MTGFGDSLPDYLDDEGDLLLIRQGDIFNLDLGEPEGSEPGYRRPHVVVQSDLLNRSRINTTVVCGITSKLKYAGLPFCVSISAGEGNLRLDSVVKGTELLTVDKGELVDWVGRLPRKRVREIIAAIQLVLEPPAV